MKYRMLLFSTLFFFVSDTIIAQNNFSIEGNIKKISSGYIYLTYPSLKGVSIKDSSRIAPSGKFFFSGTIPHPVSVFITLHNEPVDVSDENFTSFFISPGKMTVFLEKDKFKQIIVKGSPVQDESKQLEKTVAGIAKRMKPLSDAYNKEKNPEKAAVIREKMEPFFNEFKEADYRYYRAHPSSYLTAYSLRFHFSELSVKEMEEYYSGFNETVKQSSYGVLLKNEIEKLKGGSPGAVARDFSMPGLNNDTVRLSSFRQNKYVLLDFWASWCIPCRKGNPHLKELYAKYKEKALEIIGISDDDYNPEKWKKAVGEDSLPWLHVLRGIDWVKVRKGEKSENDINEKFGIHTLPTKILIDKSGIIIGRYNENEDNKLDAKLKELFGE